MKKSQIWPGIMARVRSALALMMKVASMVSGILSAMKRVALDSVSVKVIAVVSAIMLLGYCGPVAEITHTESSFYPNCKAVRAARIKTPIYRGDKAYNPHLDRDNDGVAC